MKSRHTSIWPWVFQLTRFHARSWVLVPVLGDIVQRITNFHARCVLTIWLAIARVGGVRQASVGGVAPHRASRRRCSTQSAFNKNHRSSFYLTFLLPTVLVLLSGVSALIGVALARSWLELLRIHLLSQRKHKFAECMLYCTGCLPLPSRSARCGLVRWQRQLRCDTLCLRPPVT